MTNTSSTIVFFGTDSFSLVALLALVEAGYPVGAVVTKPDSRQGRGHKITPPIVKVLATKHNIPVWQPEKIFDITNDIRSLHSPVGVLSSFGKIIPQATINLFTPGIINIHPSLLPKYRGPTPIETVIASGDSTTGVSIMQLSAKMDAGPVYAAKEHPLSGKETSAELYHALADIGASLLLETLPQIINGSLQPLAQNESHATYTRLLTKDDAWLDPSEVSAAEAEQLVRAYSIFPKTKINLHGHNIIITKAHASSETTSVTDILCKDTTYLAIEELIAPSGRRMSVRDFERGYLRST